MRKWEQEQIQSSIYGNASNMKKEPILLQTQFKAHFLQGNLPRLFLCWFFPPSQHLQHQELDPYKIYPTRFWVLALYLTFDLFPKTLYIFLKGVETHFFSKFSLKFSSLTQTLAPNMPINSTLKILRHLNADLFPQTPPAVIFWADGHCEQSELLVKRDIVAEWCEREPDNPMEEKHRRPGNSIRWQF